MTSGAWWSKETVAVVTGANRGIGHALVARLAEHGITVVLTARDDDRGEAAAAPLRQRGLPVIYRRLDVADPASVAAFADWLRDTLGGLDILVRSPITQSQNLSQHSYHQSYYSAPFAMDIHRDSARRCASSSVALGDRSVRVYAPCALHRIRTSPPRRFTQQPTACHRGDQRNINVMSGLAKGQPVTAAAASGSRRPGVRSYGVQRPFLSPFGFRASAPPDSARRPAGSPVQEALLCIPFGKN
jgi:NAD(P)-dependent dehydrogenase (short-subunit alcohol dehydrogenase family)